MKRRAASSSHTQGNAAKRSPSTRRAIPIAAALPDLPIDSSTAPSTAKHHSDDSLDDSQGDAQDVFALWSQISAGLRRDIGARSFDHWLKPIYAARQSGSVVTLYVSSSFFANWINERFAARLLLAWRQHAPDVTHIDVRGRRNPSLQTIDTAFATAGDALESSSAQAGTATSRSPSKQSRPHFDKRLTFDNFLVAQSNILAVNAARRVTEDNPQFNPLYIHSRTGQGKTHLLQAAGQAFAQAKPQAGVIYLSAERFMIDFVGSMRAGNILDFKARLRGCDMLLIDDLQFVVGKGATQEELLHTIDVLVGEQKRVIIAADRPPHRLDSIDERLEYRLSCGLVADIQPPEEELRIRILRHRLAAMPDVDFPEEVIYYLAKNFSHNIRELEGALNKLLAYASLTNVAISLSLAQDRLAEAAYSARRASLTIEAIQRAVCAHYRLDKAEMISKRRVRTIARPRQIAMYLAKEMTPRSYPEIGRRFGGRDHSTVIHAVRTVESLRTQDSEIASDIESIRRSLAS